MNPAPPRVLAIAGSDSSGGAGVQADIKTITMLGGYAMTAITAITAQNTLGVTQVETLSGAFVLEQMAACIDDIGVDAVKIGMLGSEDIVRHVGGGLLASGLFHRKDPHRIQLVVDPVMVATSGAPLADDTTIAAMRGRLFPFATLITPNLPELAALCGGPVATLEDVHASAVKLANETSAHVLAKGGHSGKPILTDLLVAPGGACKRFDSPRIETPHTHGTGCTLSSAIATLLAKGLDLEGAVDGARQFVRAALQAAPGFGSGHGPMGHQAVR